MRVLRPARRIHIRRRAAVLSNPPSPERFRPASARNKAALGTLGSSARCSGSRPLSRSLRRRSRRLRGDTRRNASSAGYRLLALRRVSPRIRRTASLHVAQFGTRPLVPCLTFHMARFLRSICARRRSVSSLNLVRVSPGAKRSRRRRAQCGVQIRRDFVRTVILFEVVEIIL